MNYDIESKLNELFSDSGNHQIVFWFDESKNFEEDIKNITLNNALIHILEDDNLIYTKYLIEHEDSESNFLIYAPFEKPDNSNYLADLINYAKFFSADKLEMIAQELNIPLKFVDVLRKHEKFFDNEKERKIPFINLNLNYGSPVDIVLGMLTVLSNQKIINLDYILREVIVNELNDENKIIKKFEKFNLLDDFWDLIGKQYKYYRENPSVFDLIKFLIINYTIDNYGINPKPWKDFIVEDRNNATVFVGEFMNNSNYSEYYDIFSNNLEPILIKNIGPAKIDSYKYADSFEIYDVNIVKHYVELLTCNKRDLGENFKELMEYRKKTHFYPKFKNEYEMLNYANLWISLFDEFNREVIPEDVDEIIDIYSEKWVYLDTYYRKFYYHYDKISDNSYAEDLRQLIENMYVNGFLSKINPIFTKELSMVDLNSLKVDKQWNFYENYLNKSRIPKTIVFISDAFRYGCAIELFDKLRKDPKRESSIKPMLSTIPSYTALGMAALLPNENISFDNDNVIVDGMKTVSKEDRFKILNNAFENSLVMKYEDLKGLVTKKIQEKLDGVDLLYVYHNKIDSIGEHSEHNVFDAAQDTIDEIFEFIKDLTNKSSFRHFYITSDHGFIYKRNKLKESEKVDLDGVILHRNKRFIISDSELNIDGSVPISMNYLDMDYYVNVPIGDDIFKAPGSGLNFVHGGASLEECIIPLLKVKTETGRAMRTVELELMDTSKRVTNHSLILTFFQKENISQGVLPLEAALYFVDDEGNKVSDERIIHANVKSNSAEKREFKEKFTFRKISYDKSKDYFLVIKDMNAGTIKEIKFIIDIAFQEGVNFF